MDKEEVRVLLDQYARRNAFRHNQKTRNSYILGSHSHAITRENPSCNDMLTIYVWREKPKNNITYSYEGSFCSLVTIATEELLEHIINLEENTIKTCVSEALLFAKSNTHDTKEIESHTTSLLPKIFTSIFSSLSLQRKQCFLLPYQIIDIIYKEKESS